MKGAGTGVLLVFFGLLVIYLGATGKLKNLGDAWDTLQGKKPQNVASNTTAPNTGFPSSPGVIASITSLFQGSAGATAATATTPEAAASAPLVFA